jgi:proliferating cell nuclear antigen
MNNTSNDYNHRIIDIQTEHITQLKTLFETLKDILHETNISFVRGDSADQDNKDKDKDNKDKDKKKKQKIEPEEKTEAGGVIKIMATDDHKTLLIRVKLDAKPFLRFYVKPAEYCAGIDLMQLYKYFKTIKEGILTIYIDDENEQYIVFEVYNDEQKSTNEFKLKLMDIDNKVYNIPPANFVMTVTINCSEFHKLCRDMHQISEFIEITCTNKKISFGCQGDSASNTKTFENCNNKDSEKGVKIRCAKTNDDSKPEIVRAIFELKYLVMFNKCTNLCTEIQLFLRNEYPLFIQYSIATLGTMVIGLVPVDEKNFSKNTNCDENFYSDTEIAIKDD